MLSSCTFTTSKKYSLEKPYIAELGLRKFVCKYNFYETRWTDNHQPLLIKYGSYTLEPKPKFFVQLSRRTKSTTNMEHLLIIMLFLLFFCLFACLLCSLIHESIILIYVTSRFDLSCKLSCEAKTLTLDINAIFSSSSFFHAYYTYWHHWLQRCYTTFTDLDLNYGVTRSAQNSFRQFHLFTHFQLISLNFDVVLKEFKLKILILLLIESYLIKGNNCSFTDCVE